MEDHGTEIKATLTVQHVFRCSAPGHETKEGIQSTPCPFWELSQLMPWPTLPPGWVVIAGAVFCDQHTFVLVDEDGQTYRLIRQSGAYGGYLQSVGVFPALAGWFHRATELLKQGLAKGVQ